MPTAGSSPLTPGQKSAQKSSNTVLSVFETLGGPAADLPYAPQYLCYQLHCQLASTVSKQVGICKPTILPLAKVSIFESLPKKLVFHGVPSTVYGSTHKLKQIYVWKRWLEVDCMLVYFSINCVITWITHPCYGHIYIISPHNCDRSKTHGTSKVLQIKRTQKIVSTNHERGKIWGMSLMSPVYSHEL